MEILEGENVLLLFISGAVIWLGQPSGFCFYCLHTTRWRNLGSDLASFAVLFIPDCVRGDIREKEVGVVARGEQTTQK